MKKPKKKIKKPKSYKTLNCVPYQLCPKCSGDGTVLVQNWNGNETSISSGPIICNVCEGEKIIPMHVVGNCNEFRQLDLSDIDFSKIAGDPA